MLVSSKDQTVFWDSRELEDFLRKSPERPFLFFARVGRSFNGNSVAKVVLGSRSGKFFTTSDAFQAYFSEHPSEAFSRNEIADFKLSGRLEFVNDVSRSLHELLNEEFVPKLKSLFSTSVTGTNGKTSVTQIFGNLISRLLKKPVLKMGTLGIQIGEENKAGSHPTMPDFPEFVGALCDAQNKGVTHIVFESTSHGLFENRLNTWKVDVAIFTNLTPDHLDFHGTMHSYFEAKLLLFKKYLKLNGVVILNADSSVFSKCVSACASPAREIIGYGSAKRAENFWKETNSKFLSAKFLKWEKSSTSVSGVKGSWEFQTKGENNFTRVNYCCPLIGEFQHENLAAAAAASLSLNFSLEDIAAACKTLPGIAGRLEKVELSSKILSSDYESSTDSKDSETLKIRAKTLALPSVFVDYAHTADALEKLLKTCRQMLPRDTNSNSPGRLICVFGCGGDRDKTKRPVMGKLAATLADIVVVTSDNPRTENPETILSEIIFGMPPHFQNSQSQTSNLKLFKEEKRDLAISKAIALATYPDIVVIAGKGDEMYQIIGTRKRPFSDQECALQNLELKLK